LPRDRGEHKLEVDLPQQDYGMTDFKIRRATLADLDTIIYHRHAMFVDMGMSNVENSTAAFRKWLPDRLAKEEYLGWFVVDSSERIIAGAGLWLIDWIPSPFEITTRRGYLMNVFTDEAHRGKGHARRLVQTTMDYCREQHIRVMLLHASDKGRSLYESLGFTATNEMRIKLEI
jgi:GNAT superfamily N-acetyltransferase